MIKVLDAGDEEGTEEGLITLDLTNSIIFDVDKSIQSRNSVAYCGLFVVSYDKYIIFVFGDDLEIIDCIK